ncbi:flagellar hook-basal body protein [Rossellomorea marisflavi]|uniref:flagellar hook-basal body protein n=1 Tax=Rossellomorea marisflavi TaxID=189381 RepID=UPI00064ED981|nr:flagellar hook-basal body protein [Rossellomorea marisflavi]KMK96005.1 flagellar basal body rod protein FlgC [Rossellomorea marisflavi]
MFRGFYTVASGMLSQQRKTEMLTNNISNANTPGYKADTAAMRAFPEMLMQRMDSTTVPTDNRLSLPLHRSIGSLNTGVYMQETIPTFTQGDLQETGNATDIALITGTLPDEGGAILFTVEGDDGEERYTRNGNFTVNGNGFLTTNSGHYVLDGNGERIQLDSDEFTLGENGEILVNGAQESSLGIAYTGNAQDLVKEGDGLFSSETALTPAQAGTFTMVQGQLERSNVDASRSMTDMLSSYRAFEANQKVLQAYDRSMDKAANEIGRVNG